MRIAFAANTMAEPQRLVAGDAPVGLFDHPGPGQCMVHGGNVVVQQVLVGLVEVDALLDDGLIVLVQGQAGGFEDAGAEEVARFDFEIVPARWRFTDGRFLVSARAVGLGGRRFDLNR